MQAGWVADKNSIYEMKTTISYFLNNTPAPQAVIQYHLKCRKNTTFSQVHGTIHDIPCPCGKGIASWCRLACSIERGRASGNLKFMPWPAIVEVEQSTPFGPQLKAGSYPVSGGFDHESLRLLQIPDHGHAGTSALPAS